MQHATASVFVSFVVGLFFPAFVSAQTVSQRGFVEGIVWVFPQEALNDVTRIVGDAVAREELFVKPAPWIQFSAGMDVRANSHDQVDASWRVDFADRGTLKPAVAVRRLAATVTRGGFAVDAGKQFIRWGKTDIVTPTDRFAPRDFLNVVSPEFLPVTGVRASLHVKNDAFEGVWLPRLTPSRVPLLDQRWTVVPPQAAGIPLIDEGAVFPERRQVGVRWSHVGAGWEFAASFFDGFNHLPNVPARATENPPAIHVARTYPAIRTYGLETAIPTTWFTIKAEAAAFVGKTSPLAPRSDDYVLYVVQLERQTGEWVLLGGYAGEAVTTRRTVFAFAPDRGLTRSIVGRAAYTIDPRRSVAFETAVHQNGNGFLGKAEYSQTRGQHWRLTVAAVGIGGHSDDFLGQYRRNSHATATVRYSF